MNSTTSAEDIGIASLICIIGTLGVLFNGFGLVIVYNNPVLANAFGKLCFSHCIANFGVCAIFLTWAAPLTITQNSGLSTSTFGKVLGQINIFFWDVCVYSHLSISINRFVSITFPLKSVLYLTPFRTRILVAAPWILAFCHVIPYFWYDQCYINYHPDTWTWDFSHFPCGKIISLYFDMYTGFIVFTIMAILDLTTLYFLRKNHQFMQLFNDREILEADAIAKSRRKIEIRFFIQSCIQGGIFFYELTNFYILCNFNKNKYYVFFTTTWSWSICHMLDGLVLCSFHLRGYQRNLRRSSLSTLRV